MALEIRKFHSDVVGSKLYDDMVFCLIFKIAFEDIKNTYYEMLRDRILELRKN